jgi:hypothetical protein
VPDVIGFVTDWREDAVNQLLTNGQRITSAPLVVALIVKTRRRETRSCRSW